MPFVESKSLRVTLQATPHLRPCPLESVHPLARTLFYGKFLLQKGKTQITQANKTQNETIAVSLNPHTLLLPQSCYWEQGLLLRLIHHYRRKQNLHHCSYCSPQPQK